MWQETHQNIFGHHRGRLCVKYAEIIYEKYRIKYGKGIFSLNLYQILKSIANKISVYLHVILCTVIIFFLCLKVAILISCFSSVISEIIFYMG